MNLFFHRKVRKWHLTSLTSNKILPKMASPPHTSFLAKFRSKSGKSNAIFWGFNEKTNSIWTQNIVIKLGYRLFWISKIYSNIYICNFSKLLFFPDLRALYRNFPAFATILQFSSLKMTLVSGRTLGRKRYKYQQVWNIFSVVIIVEF